MVLTEIEFASDVPASEDGVDGSGEFAAVGCGQSMWLWLNHAVWWLVIQRQRYHIINKVCQLVCARKHWMAWKHRKGRKIRLKLVWSQMVLQHKNDS